MDLLVLLGKYLEEESKRDKKINLPVEGSLGLEFGVSICCADEISFDDLDVDALPSSPQSISQIRIQNNKMKMNIDFIIIIRLILTRSDFTNEFTS